MQITPTALCHRPDPVTGSTVSPAALDLAKARDAAFLAPQAAAGSVDEVHVRLRVHSEVQEQTDHFPICKDA